jgi:basic amino acid/polyamine antiporter, APA family
MFPTDMVGWRGAFAGAFIAFFAFIGFETLANLAEEVQDPKQTVPRGILGAVGASIVLYVAVATAAVLADSTSSSPLLDLFEGTNASVFAAVASIAVANGVLVEIVIASCRRCSGASIRARALQLSQPCWLAQSCWRLHCSCRSSVC